MKAVRFVGIGVLLALGSCQSFRNTWGDLKNSPTETMSTVFHIEGASLKVEDVQRQPLADLKLAVDWDPYLLRVDLIRNYESGGTSPVPNAYSYLVVDLGNGVVLDANGNLCLDLVRFYGWNNARGFRIVKKPLFGNPADIGSWEKEGQSFKMGLSEARFNTGTWTDDRLYVVPHNQFGVYSTTVRKNGGIISASSSANNSGVQLTQSSNSEVHWSSVMEDTSLAKSDPQTIVIDHEIHAGTQRVVGSVRLTMADNRLQVDDHGIVLLVSNPRTYTFLKTATGAQFFSHRGSELPGIEIRRTGNLIQVFAGQALKAEYTVESVES